MKRNQIDPSAQYRENVQNVKKISAFLFDLKITDILARFKYPEIIGQQIRHLRNKFETKVGEWDTLEIIYRIFLY